MARHITTSPSHFRQPLNAILSSEGAVRVLREILLQGSALSVSELAKRSGLSRVGATAALNRLEESGTVRLAGIGHGAMYQVVAEHPLIPALQALFIAEHQRYHAVLARIRDLAHTMHPRPEAVWLYGSVARGEDRVGSDFDLAVVISPDSEVEDAAEEMRKLLRLIEDDQQISFSVIGLSLDDVERLSSARDTFWTSLAVEARTLFGSRPEELAVTHHQTTAS